jgi:hydroxyacylglutathione hydrolase
MSEALSARPPDDRRIGRVTVLTGSRGGRYPDGNSLLVGGAEETVLVDPSLSVIPRRARLAAVDRVLLSHAHEDHLAGGHLFTGAAWHVHELDAPAVGSLDTLIAGYGLEVPAVRDGFREVVVRDFHYLARPDAATFTHGEVLDLGGGTRVTVLHAPGHTRGHCVFLVEPDCVLYLADVDLSSFGPYYGDAVSSLEDFERTLAMVRGLSARWYATFHQVGLLEGRAAFLERMDRYAAVIGSREQRLLEFLRAPRSVDEVVAHRFVYRPQDRVPWADSAERRSMTQHLDRLLAGGRVREVDPGRFVAC